MKIKNIPLLVVIALFGLYGCANEQSKNEAQRILSGKSDNLAANQIDDSKINYGSSDKERISNLIKRGDSLSLKLLRVDNLINSVGQELANTNNLIDSLQQAEKMVIALENAASNRYYNGISELDNELTALEREQQIAQNRIVLSEKKVDLAEKKALLLKEEILMLDEEKGNELRDRSGKSKITALETEVHDVRNQLSKSDSKIGEASRTIDQSNRQIEKVLEKQRDLREKISAGYDSKAIISDFIERERKLIEDSLHILKVNSLVLEQKQKESIQLGNQLKKKIDLVTYQINNSGHKDVASSEKQLAIEQMLESSQEPTVGTQDLQNDQKEKDSGNVFGTILIVILTLTFSAFLILYFIGRGIKNKQIKIQ